MRPFARWFSFGRASLLSLSRILLAPFLYRREHLLDPNPQWLDTSSPSLRPEASQKPNARRKEQASGRRWFQFSTALSAGTIEFRLFSPFPLDLLHLDLLHLPKKTHQNSFFLSPPLSPRSRPSRPSRPPSTTSGPPSQLPSPSTILRGSASRSPCSRASASPPRSPPEARRSPSSASATGPS